MPTCALAFVCILAFAEPSADSLREIARSAQGKVGMAAVVLETGQTASLDANGRFPMQSVYKMPIAMAVLREVDRGALQLDQRVTVTKADYVRTGQHSPIRDAHPDGAEVTLREILRLAVSESDGSASDVALKLAGGPKSVMEMLKGLGVTGVMVANTEKEIGGDNAVQYRNWAEPAAMIRLLRAVHEGRGLSAASHSLLLGWMTETQTGPKRIKGLLPEGTVVAHKTGASGTVNGITAATNDAGLVRLPNGRTMAIAVFVSDSRAETAERELVIARLTKALWDAWAGTAKR